MTTEYLFTSDLDDSKVLDALKRIDSAVDDLVRNAASKFDGLQKSVGGAFGVGTSTAGTRQPTATSPALDEARVDKAELDIVKAILEVKAKIQAIEKVTNAETRAAAKARLDTTKANLSIVRQTQSIEKADNAEERAAAASVLASRKAELQIERQGQVISAGERRAEQQAAKLAETAAANDLKLQQQVLRLEQERLSLVQARQRAGQISQAAVGAFVGGSQVRVDDDLAQARTTTAQSGFGAAKAELDLQQQRIRLQKQELAQVKQLNNEHRKGGGDAARRTALLTNAYFLLSQAIGTAVREVTRFFSQMIRDSIKAAENLDSVETSFRAIFGSAEVGGAVLEEVRQKGLELGGDISETVRKFLPLVGSLEQALKLSELAASLAQVDPTRGLSGALVSINEALSGDLVSLRRAFELPTDNVKRLQSELGIVEGTIEGITQLVEERGLGFAQQQESLSVALNRAQQRIQFFKEEFGQPIGDELIEGLNNIFETLDERSTDFRVFAGSIGESLGKAFGDGLELINNFLQGLTSDELEDFAADFAANMSLIKGLLAEVLEFFGLIEDASENTFGETSAIEDYFDKVLTLKNMLETLTKVFSILEAVQAKAAARFREVQEILREGGNPFGGEGAARVDVAGEEAFAKAINEGVAALEASARAADDSRQAMQDRREELEKSTAAELALADAIIAKNAATAAVETAGAELETAQEEVDTEVADAQEEFSQDVADAQLEAERKRLDIEEEYAQKRVDLAKENAQEIADIMRDYAHDIADAARDLARDEQDIIRKHNQTLQDIEKERADNRVEIEEDFQQKLQDIRRKFDFDAEEAIRANDAVALLKIRRRMQFELEEAKIARDQKIQEEDQSRNEAFEKEQENIRRLLEESKIANAEKLEDLQINLARRLEEQEIAYQREMEQLQIEEARKQEEVNKSLQRQLEDLQTALNRRLTELQESLADETAALTEALAAQAEAERRHNAALAAIMAERQRIRFKGSQGGLTGDDAPGTPGSSEPLGKTPNKADKDTEEDDPLKPPTKATKNPINPNAGTPADPNLGFSRRVSERPPSATQANIINNTTNSVGLSMTDPTQLSPAQLRAMQNIAVEVVREAIA